MRMSQNIRDAMHTASYTEVVIRFAQWMHARGALETTARDVRQHFPVSWATSFRWLGAWRAASGLPSLGDLSPHHTKKKRKS